MPKLDLIQKIKKSLEQAFPSVSEDRRNYIASDLYDFFSEMADLLLAGDPQLYKDCYGGGPELVGFDHPYLFSCDNGKVFFNQKYIEKVKEFALQLEGILGPLGTISAQDGECVFWSTACGCIGAETWGSPLHVARANSWIEPLLEPLQHELFGGMVSSSQSMGFVLLYRAIASHIYASNARGIVRFYTASQSIEKYSIFLQIELPILLAKNLTVHGCYVSNPAIAAMPEPDRSVLCQADSWVINESLESFSIISHIEPDNKVSFISYCSNLISSKLKELVGTPQALPLSASRDGFFFKAALQSTEKSSLVEEKRIFEQMERAYEVKWKKFKLNQKRCDQNAKLLKRDQNKLEDKWYETGLETFDKRCKELMSYEQQKIGFEQRMIDQKRALEENKTLLRGECDRLQREGLMSQVDDVKWKIFLINGDLELLTGFESHSITDIKQALTNEKNILVRIASEPLLKNRFQEKVRRIDIRLTIVQQYQNYQETIKLIASKREFIEQKKKQLEPIMFEFNKEKEGLEQRRKVLEEEKSALKPEWEALEQESALLRPIQEYLNTHVKKEIDDGLETEITKNVESLAKRVKLEIAPAP